MDLSNLRPPKGAKHSKKRIGRGQGSGQGKTAGRGTKGYKARHQPKLGFEGGQMPLARRIPKRKGFTNPNRVEYQVVNVERLGQVFDAKAQVDPDAMRERGLVRAGLPVKVLARGDIDRALTVRAHAFSATARQKIEQAGGSAEVIG
jgi:large subunit ribosomal protein L15